MSAIGPGDFVECVDASPPDRHDRGSRLVVGALYRIARLDITPYRRLPACWVVGVDVLWRISRFRPIYRPRERAFDHLLTTIPVNTPEPA